MKQITNRVAHYGHSVLRYVGQYKHQPEGDAPAEVCHSGVLDLMSKLAKYEDSGLEPEDMRWIPVAERLPESQKTVLISARDKTFGYRHTLMAAHIGHHEAKTEDYGWQEYEGDTEYDEEADCFWIPECWWESNFVEDNTNWIIDSDYEVTHWMPLPEPPKEVQ